MSIARGHGHGLHVCGIELGFHDLNFMEACRPVVLDGLIQGWDMVLPIGETLAFHVTPIRMVEQRLQSIG